MKKEKSQAPNNGAVSDMDEYLFDLRGYLLLEKAIDKKHVARLNKVLDKISSLEPPLQTNEWYGCVHAHSYGGREGTNLQQIYEAGAPFEELIDNPNWIEKVRHFVGGEGTFDYKHGPLFIDENFANLRGPGEAIGLHSGGHTGTKRTQFRFHNGKFHCGQINVLMALTDIGPGDGATMVIPGSHKANFVHPQFESTRMKGAGIASSVDGVEGAIEIHMQKGDAILFVDGISHGSAERKNAGERRIAVFRYGPSWGFFRHPYRPSQELLARLTPARREIVFPTVQTPLRREPNRLPDTPREAFI
jgi:hypothetical protein